MLKRLYYFLFVNDLIEPCNKAIQITAKPVKKSITQDISRLVLCCYILFIFKPAMPFVADKIAHTFWENYHILTVHQVNGKFHVHLEMANDAKQSGKDKSAGIIKTGAEEYFQFTCQHTSKILYPPCINRPYHVYHMHFPVTYPTADIKPPKMA